MKKVLFFRCNGGHYFQGTGCPWDGWTMDGVAQAAEYFRTLSQEGQPVGLAAMAAVNPSEALLRRMVIIEFGDDAVVFDALVPERYLYQGEEVLANDVDDSLY